MGIERLNITSLSSIRLFLCELAFKELEHRKALQAETNNMFKSLFQDPEFYMTWQGTLTRCSRPVSSGFNFKDSNNFTASWNPSMATSSFCRLLSTSATFARETATSRICKHNKQDLQNWHGLKVRNCNVLLETILSTLKDHSRTAVYLVVNLWRINMVNSVQHETNC